MNSISIAGVLGKDSDMRSMPNGDAVCNFSIADSMGKDKPTIWWNCQLMGKRAESLGRYLVKGQAVTVSGSVSEREWTDRDGVVKKSMNVRVQDVALQGGRREQEERPAPRQAPKQDSFDDQDLPF
jgi:single-strand DNA-binding protein